MTFRRYAQTDYQEEQLEMIEKIANALKFKLRFGTSIGKSPQTLLFDHDYQDGILRVSSDDEYGISFDGEDNISLMKLKELMKAKLEEEKKVSP